MVIFTNYINLYFTDYTINGPKTYSLIINHDITQIIKIDICSTAL